MTLWVKTHDIATFIHILGNILIHFDYLQRYVVLKRLNCIFQSKGAILKNKDQKRQVAKLWRIEELRKRKSQQKAKFTTLISFPRLGFGDSRR